MSDTILIINDLLIAVEKSLRTMTLTALPNEYPGRLWREDWEQSQPEQRRAMLLRRRGQLLEAQRYKEALSSSPYSGQAAAKLPGDLFWIQRAASYQGTE